MHKMYVHTAQECACTGLCVHAPTYIIPIDYAVVVRVQINHLQLKMKSKGTRNAEIKAAIMLIPLQKGYIYHLVVT